MEIVQEVEREAFSSSPAPTFLGRSEILDTVKQHILKGQYVCLYGDRGISKTTITKEKDEKNLKPLLARFELGHVPPLSRSEAYDLMEAFLVEHPVPSTDPKYSRKAVWDASKGYPTAIRDLS